MIELTRLNGTTVFVNPDHIRYVEICPDTLITFADGKTLLVKERPLEIAAQVRQFRTAPEQNSDPVPMKEL